MEFMAIVDAKARHAADCAVVGVYENGDLGVAARQIDKQLDGIIMKLHRSGDFAAKLGDSIMLPLPQGLVAGRLLLIGLGSRAAFARKQYRKALQSSAQALAKTGSSQAALYLAMEPVAELDMLYRARFIAEVFCAHAYKIPDLKTAAKPKARPLASILVATADAKGAKAAAAGLRVGAALGSGLKLARDLANLPPNVCTPTYMGERAKELAKEFRSIKTKVLDKAAIKALKMGAFLAVSQGSEEPPRLIVCEYQGVLNQHCPSVLSARASPSIPAGFHSRIPPPWTR